MKKVNYEKLEKSIYHLKRQYKNLLHLDQRNVPSLDKEAIKESVIQRFAICHDTLWKYLKKHLREKEKLVDLPNSPNGIFRKFYEVKAIDKNLLKRLMEYNQLRVNVSHDYSGSKAENSLKQMKSFIQDAEKIYKIINP